MNNKIEMGNMLSETVLSFARYTITDRHFVYIEDGLKPSQRRILYAMYKDGLLHNKYRAKTFDILGSVSNYSPHGTQTLDGAMARLTNDTSLYPLIDGKGSFSSITSRDVSHASSRYTEGRLSNLAEELFSDINKDAVDFVDNYNEQRKEPSVLPSNFPHVLTSADSGMGMGISMRTASFNLSDVVDNTIRILKNEPTEIMYPDFKTKGQVVKDESEALKVKNDGKGKFVLRGKYDVSEDKRTVYIREIPYTATREGIIDKVIKMVKSGELPQVVDINDMTSSSGMEIEIKVKKNTDIKQLMAKLYAKTDLELNYNCDYWVVYEGKPYHLGTDDILKKWIQFRAKTIKRIKEFELKSNKKKLDSLYGLKKILDDLDKAIDIIRKSEDDKVISNLVESFDLTEEQAKDIVDTKLRNLTKTNINKKIKEIEAIEKENTILEKIINNKKMVAKIMIKELTEIKSKYAEGRMTEIVEKEEVVEYVDLSPQVDDYNVKVFITKENYIKKIPLTSLRGDYEIRVKDGDSIIEEFETTNSEELFIFTDKQNVYKKRLYEIEDSKPSTLGVFAPNEISMDKDETINYIAVGSKNALWMLFAFEDGKVAKVDLEAYRTKQNRSVLRNSHADKRVVLFKLLSEDIDLMAIADNEKTVMINTSIINSKSSKTTQGSAFIKLKEGSVVSEYKVIEDSENYEYYRLKSAGTGKYKK